MNPLPDPWSFAFSSPTRIVFGDGTLSRASAAIPFDGPLLIVTGKSSALRSGHLDRLLAALHPRKTAVFSGISPNPRVHEVLLAAEIGRQINASAVIGLGGGSALDAAKATAAALAGANLSQLLLTDSPAPATTLPIIAIPTTAGTGSETSQAAILTDESSALKQGLRGPALTPHTAIVDPELTLSLPDNIAAETGFDVFTHALESWVSSRASALTAFYSEFAIRTVLSQLPLLLNDRAHPAPRRAMSLASLLMGWNLANASTCLPHRLQYPVGQRTDSSHPGGLAALYPAWMRRAAPLAPTPFSCIASLLGASSHLDAPDAVASWMHSIGMARHLHQFGLSSTDIPALTAAVRGNLATDPCDHSPDALAAIYSESL